MKRGKINVFIDNFDNDAIGEIPKRQGPNHDIAVLKQSTRISIFWITETQARAERITKWEKAGELVLDKSLGYPWLGVRSVNL